MARTFPLEIITPQQEFWQQPVDALTLTTAKGSMTVLAGHMLLVASIARQQLRFRVNGEWKTACCADGFLEVRPDEVLLFVQDCAWPQELADHLAQEERARSEEQALRRRSILEHKASAIDLTRAMVKLRHPELTQQD